MGIVLASVMEVFVMLCMLSYFMSNRVMTFVVMWYLFSLKMVYKVEREFFFGVEDCYPVETVA